MKIAVITTNQPARWVMNTKGANTVAPSGTTWPVAFSTRFSALPCEACESAIELDSPLLQIDQAE